MEIHLPHEITYDFDEQATVEEVAKSLLAQERLVREAVAIFASCFDGLEVTSTKVTFVSVSQESPLKEILAAAIFLQYQSDLVIEVPSLIRDLTGVEVPSEYHTLITVFVLVAAIYGASYLYERFSKRGSASALPKEYERLIQAAADAINVSPTVVEEAVERRLGKGRKRSIARAARDFFAPAQRHKARSIKSARDLEIGSDVIGEVPSDIDIESFEAETDSYLMENVAIEFQAHDLGGLKRGWAAVVPEVSESRKSMHIDPSVNVEAIFTKKEARGDVIVFAEMDEQGEYQPKLYYLQRLSEPGS
ncbi:MAG: hypothetical protein COW30_05530 [Rhodospirillales bacterium CG15_BIG_FIL_POST_REV_8_21_14_020_66_15]|nr:MAG: hypothetical protein COW30_05530 [Rhodospirillales bacterium CG15_BIG_FIL_POST_REV_8_21_14_020_66_15]